MILRYNFDDNGPAFEYNVDISDFVDSLNPAQICIIAKELYNADLVDDFTKKEIKDSFAELNIPDDFDTKYENPDVLDCARYILENTDDDTLYSILDDTIKAYFESEAREQYDDAEAYRKDPYAYNGVRPSDFF